jgi:outer membrane protein TolC
MAFVLKSGFSVRAPLREAFSGARNKALKLAANDGVYSAHLFLQPNVLVTPAGHLQRPEGAGRRGTAAAPSRGWFIAPLLGLVVLLAAGCSRQYYHAQADKSVYGILGDKQRLLTGGTNAFTIDTAWSKREPKDIRWEELFGHSKGGGGRRVVTIDEAIRLAIEHNRQYQFRKETLYLTALTLTGERREFYKIPFGTGNVGVARDADGDGRVSGGASVGFDQLLQSGGSISASLANDLLRYFSGDPRRSVSSVISLNFAQPLLRGAGADIVAENLRQAERDVIYDLRAFALFQQTFALDVVTTYYRLLQRKDAVRNAWNNFEKLRKTRDLLEAQSMAERRAKFEVDQARQQELQGKTAYIGAVVAYQNALDQFKITLVLPLGVDVALDDSALDDLRHTGLLPVATDEEAAFAAAVDRKLDILNAIDQLEDSKRKIVVAANRLRGNVTLVSGVSLANDAVNYSKFDISQYRANAGLQLDLPFERMLQRNAYRTTLITFERTLRSLGQTLDTSRDSVRQGLRTLEQLQQNYIIQTNALELANRRVGVTDMLLQAGRAQTRDQLEAQTAQLTAQNAVTATLVDHLTARLRFLVDVGALQIDGEKWWVRPQPVPLPARPLPVRPANISDQAVASPDQVFGN